MIRRAALLGIAALLALTGCATPREPPPGMSDEALSGLLSTRIDQAWVNTGLDGVVDRPSLPVPSVPATFDELAACLVAVGMENWSLSDGSAGPAFGVEDEMPEAEAQLAFYVCFAQHPTGIVMGGVLLSDAQLDYLYDYYHSWVIPCLAERSITVTSVPTRQEFFSGDRQGWNPYDYASLRDEEDYNAAVRECGPIYADLDVVDPFRRGETLGFTGTSFVDAVRSGS